jgi:hypothetical protein|tara:strand:- start:4098 stop:4331 length:234 start_codon:yes stop_codon:yes gene_type:complete
MHDFWRNTTMMSVMIPLSKRGARGNGKAIHSCAMASACEKRGPKREGRRIQIKTDEKRDTCAQTLSMLRARLCSSIP